MSQQWEDQFAVMLASAMRMAIVLWNSEEVQSLSAEGRAEMMACLSQSYAESMIADAREHFGGTSSS